MNNKTALFLFLLAAFFIPRQGYGQQLKFNEIIRTCIINSDNTLNPTEGLDIEDSSNTLQLTCIYKSDTTINLISFDSKKRICYFKTRLGEAYLQYKEDMILLKAISYSGEGIFCQDTVVQQYKINAQGQLIWSKSCKQDFYTYIYEKQSYGTAVKVIKDGSIIRQHLFIYGSKNNYFQWQIITDRNVAFKFKRSEIGTEVNLDSYPHVDHVLIENAGELKKNTDDYNVVRHTISDALGKNIGSVLISKVNLK